MFAAPSPAVVARVALPALVTFVFFVLEAILHFSIGRTGSLTSVVLPDRREFGWIILVVFTCSVACSVTSEVLRRWIKRRQRVVAKEKA
jgi:hypothetical protein